MDDVDQQEIWKLEEENRKLMNDCDNLESDKIELTAERDALRAEFAEAEHERNAFEAELVDEFKIKEGLVNLIEQMRTDEASLIEERDALVKASGHNVEVNTRLFKERNALIDVCCDMSEFLVDMKKRIDPMIVKIGNTVEKTIDTTRKQAESAIKDDKK